MKDFVTAAVFTYQSEYSVLELLLQREGIKYVFQNETVIQVLPFHSNALGGIKLRVHKNDLDKVREIIRGLKNNSSLHIV